MYQPTDCFVPRVSGTKGFTIMEAMVVMVIITILSIFAVPYSQQWIRNSEYKAAARSMVNILRAARSNAINKNLEHRVEFETGNKRFRIIQGNKSIDSNEWNTVISDWQSLPPGVSFSANVEAIHMNPNGTANGGTISILDNMQVTKYEVCVTKTGRIRIPAAF
jgi:prepilin-type N-terminal cleavage/methylation domain-containing protein